MTVPPGCDGINMQDGTRYNSSGGYVHVDDRHVNAVRAHYGPLGIIDAALPLNLGTRATRWCRQCQPTRAWNSWNHTCPRCGADTIEQEKQHVVRTD